MVFAFFFFILTLIVLPHALHARHLHDESIHGSLEPQPLPQTAEMIQMVTIEEELQSPPSYGRVNPKAPPSPKEAPTQGQTNLGRDNPKAPPPPKVAPSRGQTTYGSEYNPDSKSQSTYLEELPDLQAKVSQKPSGLIDEIIYGRDDPRKPLSPDPNGSEGQGMFGQDDPKGPPSLDPNGSHGQSMFGRELLTPDQKNLQNKFTSKHSQC